MSGYTFFDDEEGLHSVAHEYIALIKKKPNGGLVRYDSGDFLALDQHDRKRVIQSLMEYEEGFRILDTLRDRIKKSEMYESDKAEILEIIKPLFAEDVVPEPMTGPLREAIQPVVPIVEEKPVVKKSFLDRFFNIIKRKL